jgi:hypothetical protein
MPQTVLLRCKCGRRSSIRAKRGMPQATKRAWVRLDRPAKMENTESALGRDEKPG